MTEHLTLSIMTQPNIIQHYGFQQKDTHHNDIQDNNK